LRRLVIDLVVAATIIVLIAVFYRGSILSYIETLQLGEYSYLIVLTPTVLYITAELVGRHGMVKGFELLRAAALLGGVLLASSLYVLSRIMVEYSMQIELLSLVVLVSSILLLVYGEFDRPSIPLIITLLLLLLIPVPRLVVDYLSMMLTNPLVNLASLVTGAETFIENGVVGLRVVDGLGYLRVFYIAPECSGVVSLMTVLALLPLMLYIVLRSPASWRARAWALGKALIAALLVVFAGNVLRVILVVIATRSISYDAAMELFHSTPAIVYVAIATAISSYIVLKLPRGSDSGGGSHVVSSGTGLAKTMLLAVAVLVFLTASTSAYTTSIQGGQVAVDPARLLEAPGSVVFNATSNSTVMQEFKSLPNPRIGEALGALAVYNVVINYNGSVFYGYIELAESPSRFHSWVVCLTVQGYSIDEYWSEVGSTTVTYMVASKGFQKLLLAYTIYGYHTWAGDIYVKLTLMAPISQETRGRVLSQVNSLMSVINVPKSSSIQYQNYLLTTYIGLTIMLASSITGLIQATRRYTHRKPVYSS